MLGQSLAFPGPGVTSGIKGLCWGQDGLAYVLSPSAGSSTTSSQVFLLRGPFVLPAEAYGNPTPTLTGTDPSTVAVGAGNLYVIAEGTGFLPGATVLVNGSARTTNFVDASHLSVAIPASDVQNAAVLTLTCQNPGSAASGSTTITVH